MQESAFERTNWLWQIQQSQQRWGEWLEWQIKSWLSWLNPKWNVPDLALGRLAKVIEYGVKFLAILALIWIIWKIALRLFPALRNLRLGFLNWRKRSLSPRPSPSVMLSSQQWVARSQRFYETGDYYQACRCLYLAMLEQLHERRWIPHQVSRTDREYQYLVWQLPDPDPYEALLQVHQLLCFGDRPATSQQYQQCRQAYEAILRGASNP